MGELVIAGLGLTLIAVGVFAFSLLRAIRRDAAVVTSASASGGDRHATADAYEAASPAVKQPAPTKALDWYSSEADNDDADGILTRTQFLRTVRREKRRTDDANSALSLALLKVDSARAGSAHSALKFVRTMIRETDYTAVIDDDSLAVLLPATDDEGIAAFLDKIASRRPAHVLSVEAATYPGEASFDRLLAERMGTPRSRRAVDGEALSIDTSPGYPLKRMLDVVGSFVALVLLAPLLIVIALLIKLASPGPVIFRQQRIGLGGVPFTYYKFRSMRTNVDDRAHREFVASLINGKVAPAGADATGGQFKMKADPRVTAIGRFIRKTSIDEVPQFWNVLKGDMSLVGPRPPVPYVANRYKAWHRRRVFELKPGLTGIWQVEGRSRVSFDEMVRMDLRYLRECSLGFDLRLLLRTVQIVLLQEQQQERPQASVSKQNPTTVEQPELEDGEVWVLRSVKTQR